MLGSACLLGCPDESLALVDADGDGAPLPLDCDDGDPAIRPDAGETCGNTLDDDCDGLAVGCGPAGWMDADQTAIRILAPPTDSWEAGIQQVFGGTDIDGDGIDDVLVEGVTERGDGRQVSLVAGPILDDVDLYGSSPIFSAVSPSYARMAVAITDTDGLATPDLVLGVSPEAEASGVVAILEGPPGDSRTALDADATITLDFDSHPAMIVGVGDTDGDGPGGFMVEAGFGDEDSGAWGLWVLQGPFAGAVDLRTAGLLLSTTGKPGGGYGGLAAGDLNGDGLDDIAVQTVFGEADPVVGIVMAPILADQALSGADSFITAAADAYFGENLAIGDANGDGVNDVLATARIASTVGLGAAYLLRGPLDRTLSTESAAATIVGTVETGGYWHSAQLAGDTNGDGTREIVLGNASGCWSRGCVCLQSGGVSGTHDCLEAPVLVGSAANENLGEAISGAGDLDQDGFGDVIVAAPNYAEFGESAGAAWLLQGGLGF